MDSPAVELTHYCDFGEQKESVAFLANYGLHFNAEGKLVDVNNQPFVFNVFESARDNQGRYEDICSGVEWYVNDLLEQRLERVPVRQDKKGTTIFVSKDFETSEHLLVLIHGSGAVRAGQWSRRLIINDSLDSGTQLPYIDRALSLGWGVLVTNTNDNSHHDEGSKSPSNHGKFVWEHFVKDTAIKKIAIVAHSAGGGVTTDILNKYYEDFKKRVFAIAFTDAFGQPSYSSQVYFKRVTTNWVTSRYPLGTLLAPRSHDMTLISAGTPTHEETSHVAIDKIFEYITDSFTEPNPGGAVDLADERRAYGTLEENEPSERYTEVETDTKEENSKSLCARLWERFMKYMTPFGSSLFADEERAPVSFLEKEGLHFNKKGKLVDTCNEPFMFDYYADHKDNQSRYENICTGVEWYVNDLLAQRLKRTSVRGDNKGTSIYVSRNYQKKEHLLVLIHGSGAVRAGQWSRRLIISDSLDSGTQLPYINRALSLDWGVLVTNTNDNSANEGSRSPTDHGIFVWKSFVLKDTAIKKIAIVAHGAGGGVTTEILNRYYEDFKQRVFAIAFTDAFGHPSYSAEKYFKKVTTNWVASLRPLGTVVSHQSHSMRCVSAGTPVHEETSHVAIDSVFNYIVDSFNDRTPGNAVAYAEQCEAEGLMIHEARKAAEKKNMEELREKQLADANKEVAELKETCEGNQRAMANQAQELTRATEQIAELQADRRHQQTTITSHAQELQEMTQRLELSEQKNREQEILLTTTVSIGGYIPKS